MMKNVQFLIFLKILCLVPKSFRNLKTKITWSYFLNKDFPSSLFWFWNIYSSYVDYMYKSMLSGKYYRLLPPGSDLINHARNINLDCVIEDIHCLPDEVCFHVLENIQNSLLVQCNWCLLWCRKCRRLSVVLSLSSQV